MGYMPWIVILERAQRVETYKVHHGNTVSVVSGFCPRFWIVELVIGKVI